MTTITYHGTTDHVEIRADDRLLGHLPPTTKARSRDRNRFLADVLIIAIECGRYGTGAWAVAQEWGRAQWGHDDHPEHTHVLLVEFDGETPGGELDAKLPMLVTVDHIASGLNLLVNGDCDDDGRVAGVHVSNLGDLATADRLNDAGEIDAWAADVVMQAAVLGTVVFG